MVNLHFQHLGLVGIWMQWRQKRRRPWKVAFHHGDAGLQRRRVEVVGRDIQDLIKFSLRFREATMEYVAKSALEKQGNVAWVEPLGLIVIRLALVLLAPVPR